MTTASDLLAAIMEPEPEPVRKTGTSTTIEFTLKKFVLQALLEKAITVVPTRDVMPVLKCFQFQIDPQRLRIVASDMEMTLIATTALISVTRPGTAVFPARKLLDIVKSADDADVHIRITGTTARIVIGAASWVLQLQGGYDYPPMPAIGDAAFHRVDKKTFIEAITAVRYAASRDPSRTSLNIIDIRDGKLTACDGTRIQQIRINGLPLEMRLPINAVDDLLRLLKITDVDTIDIGQSDTKLIFKLGSDVFIVSKLRANFPDMEATMLRPAMENKHSIIIGRDDLINAIKRIRITADDGSSAITLTIGADTLTIAARDKTGNEATEPVIISYIGPSFTLCLNHKYLADMISAYPGPQLEFRLGTDTKTRRAPILLRDQDTGFYAVIQQMQMDWSRS
jgi:DNA polymerase-3 subunit beta